MSKEGSLNRIAKYKRMDNKDFLIEEEAFFKEHYGVAEAPVEEKKESSKKSK
tara:strand:- start:48 stop:203 length:156 start_codon:yes stop_codon:yes gene_type:complete